MLFAFKYDQSVSQQVPLPAPLNLPALMFSLGINLFVVSRHALLQAQELVDADTTRFEQRQDSMQPGRAVYVSTLESEAGQSKADPGQLGQKQVHAPEHQVKGATSNSNKGTETQGNGPARKSRHRRHPSSTSHVHRFSLFEREEYHCRYCLEVMPLPKLAPNGQEQQDSEHLGEQAKPDFTENAAAGIKAAVVMERLGVALPPRYQAFADNLWVCGTCFRASPRVPWEYGRSAKESAVKWSFYIMIPLVVTFLFAVRVASVRVLRCQDYV